MLFYDDQVLWKYTFCFCSNYFTVSNVFTLFLLDYDQKYCVYTVYILFLCIFLLKITYMLFITTNASSFNQASAFLKKIKILCGPEKILFKVLLTTPYASFETKFDHQKYSEPIKSRQSKGRRLPPLGSRDFYYTKYYVICGNDPSRV